MDLLQFSEGEVCSDIIKQTQIFIVEQLFEGIPTNGVFSIALYYIVYLSASFKSESLTISCIKFKGFLAEY